MSGYCNRRDCKYWKSPASGIEHTCDYMMLTGHSRIAQIKDRKIRGDFARCPVFEKGQRQKQRNIEPDTRPVRYDWTLGRKLYKEGASDREIGDALGCDKKTVRQWRARHHLPSKKPIRFDWDLGRKLYDAGALDREIAEVLGCAHKTVEWWRRENGLPSNRDRRRRA